MMTMDAREFERLNFLSEKALHNTITSTELAEFNQLLNLWNIITEVSLFNGKYDSQSKN